MSPGSQTLRVRFPPLGAAVDLESPPAEVAELLSRRWMADLRPHGRRAREGFLLRWRSMASSPRLREVARRPVPAPVRWRSTAAGGSLTNRGGRIDWPAGRREATVSIDAECPRHPEQFEPLVEAALALALANQSTCFMHAAAVAIGGHRLLVVGPSGSGKSTLTSVFALAGGCVVSDDSLILGRRRNRLVARAARRDLWLRGAAPAVARALHDRGLEPEPAADGRLRLRRGRHPDAFRAHLRPNRILALRRDLRLTSFELTPLDQAEALAHLARGTSALYLGGRALAPRAPSPLELLAGFAEQLPAAELRVGRALVAEPERCLAAILESLAGPAAAATFDVPRDTGAGEAAS